MNGLIFLLQIWCGCLIYPWEQSDLRISTKFCVLKGFDNRLCLYSARSTMNSLIRFPIRQALNTFSLYGATVTRRTRRGTKAGRNVIRRVRVVTGVNKNVTSVKQTGANADNLIRCGNNISSLCGSFNINTRITNNFHRKSSLLRTCELANLIKIPTHATQNSPGSVKLYSVNCRSVKNKAQFCVYI